MKFRGQSTRRSIGALFCACLLGAGALASGAASAQGTELKFAVFPPPEGTLVKSVIGPWVNEVNAALEGTNVKVRLFAGGTLGRDPAQQFKLVRDKVADIGYVVMGYTPGDFPGATVFELPFLFENSLEGSLTHWRLHERGVMRGYDRARLIGAFTIPPQSLHSKQKLARMEDLKGQRIRTAGPYQSAAVEMLGGTAVTGIPVPSAAEAISRGVVDGTLSDWNGIVAFRIGDAAKNHLEIPLGSPAAGVFMNLDVYNALPPAAKAVFDKLGGAELSRRHGMEFDRQYRENLEATRPKKDHAITVPSAADQKAIKAKLQPITSRWIEESPDGRKLYDATVSIVEEIRKSK